MSANRDRKERMMADIVERLRTKHIVFDTAGADAAKEAADEIETLRQKVRELEKERDDLVFWKGHYERTENAELAALKQQGEPVAWAATSEEGKVEALGFNESRRFDTPLCFCSAPTIPEGFVLVPVEPTPEMFEAGSARSNYGIPNDIYKAMLAAAPKPKEKE